jgi:malic enzyme
LATRIKNIGLAIAGLGAAGVAIGNIAHQFGLLNDEQAKTFNSAMMVVGAVGVLINVMNQVGITHRIYAAATGIAAGAQTAFNITLTAGQVLLGVGIATVIAAAAAMAYLASQTNAATASVKGYNAAVSDLSTSSRSISRSGDEALRRGIED